MKHHKELIGDEFKVRNIIKTEKKRKKVMKKIKEEQTSNPPKWFTFWVQNDFAPFKEKVERIEKRLDNLIKKNNLKE
ncbi:MAG: hypothetical protein LBV53_00900 [Mycoplasmataceae bacterium]|nr:hypothetical protein [Mycoplasmataceae bacterium]